jgi:hypothetical protein
MAKRQRPNPRRVKIHRTYTVEEITHLFGSHKNTVRAWVKAGLPTCDEKRPVLILGRDLVAFLQGRRAKHKRPCKPGELYCVRCRSAKAPAGQMADYRPVTEKFGNLEAICSDCYCMMNRRVSAAKLMLVVGKLSVVHTKAGEQVSNRTGPTVNSDLGGRI